MFMGFTRNCKILNLVFILELNNDRGCFEFDLTTLQQFIIHGCH